MQKLIALSINCISTMRLAFKMVEDDLCPKFQMYLFENVDMVFKWSGH